MKTVFYILVGAFVVSAGSTALGAMLLRALRITVSRWEALAVSFLAGSALFSSIWFMLGVNGLAYRGVAYGVSAAFLLAALLTRSFQWEPESGESLSSKGWLGFAILFLPFLGIYILYALHPEVSADGSFYHNGFLNLYSAAHRIYPVNDTLYAGLSQGVEIQTLPGFLIGRHCVPGLVQLVYLISLTLLIVEVGRHFGGSKVGWTAAFLVFAAPIVGYVSTQALNDIGVTAVVFGAFFCMLRWWGTREPGWLVPAGLLSGFAYAVKYSAYPAVILFAAFVAWRWLRSHDIRWPWVLAGAICVAAMVLPYFIRNWAWYGNPLAPFENAWFPNPNFSPWQEWEYRANQRTYGWLTSYWDVPWDVAFGGRNLQGIFGPVVLLLPLGLLALRSPLGQVLFGIGCILLVNYPQNVGARFLMPSFPFFALLLASVASRWREGLGAVLAMHAITCWPTLVRAYTDENALILAPIPTLAQVTREIPEDETLAYRLNTYTAARWLDQNAKPGDRVFTNAVYVEAYTKFHACSTHASTRCYKLSDIFQSAFDNQYKPGRELVFTFPGKQVSALRLWQTGEGKERWDLREISLYRGGDRISIPKGTRLRANSNEEDLPNLLDGKLVTGWSPWQYLAPGQYVELQFPNTLEIDSVQVRTSMGHSASHVTLETRTGDADWATLAAKATIDASVDVPDLRRNATAELYSRGIRFIFAMTSDGFRSAMEKDPEAWHVELAGQGGDWRIFRLLDPASPPAVKKDVAAANSAP